jgi:hypothetical protein
MDCEDVGVVQCGRGTGFLFETMQTFQILGKTRWQNLDGYVARQSGISRTIDFAHAPGSQ